MVKPYYAGLPVGAAQMTSHAIGADVTSLAFSPEGERLAVATTDGQVRVFRVHSTGDFSGSVRYFGHRQAVNTVAWSPDGMFLASGSHDRTVQIWTSGNGLHVRTLTGHSGAVSAVVWSPLSGMYLASAGTDKCIQLWRP